MNCETFSTVKELFGEGKETKKLTVLNTLKTTCVTNTAMILIRNPDLKSAYNIKNNMNTKFTYINTDAITVWGKCITFWEEFYAIYFNNWEFSLGKKPYFRGNLRQTISQFWLENVFTSWVYIKHSPAHCIMLWSLWHFIYVMLYLDSSAICIYFFFNLFIKSSNEWL